MAGEDSLKAVLPLSENIQLTNSTSSNPLEKGKRRIPRLLSNPLKLSITENFIKFQKDAA